MVKFSFPDRFFVTGTDTGVGKTVVCALLAAGLKTNYWKPVQSGSVEGLDSETVRTLAGLEHSMIVPEAYVFQKPVSPHLAAEMEGVRIDFEQLNLLNKPADLIIEGAGGLMVPLCENVLILDLIDKLALPVLIVARNTLGTINHTLLTVETLKNADLDIMGVVLNGVRNDAHVKTIEHFGKVPVLAQLEPFSHFSPTALKDRFHELFL